LSTRKYIKNRGITPDKKERGEDNHETTPQCQDSDLPESIHGQADVVKKKRKGPDDQTRTFSEKPVIALRNPAVSLYPW
jgi:hypothetical protein